DPLTIDKLQSNLVADCWAFMPELVLCGTIVLLLLLRLVPAMDHSHLGLESLILTLLAFAVSFLQWRQLGDLRNVIEVPGRDMFGGLLRYDNFTIYLRLFLFGFTALTIWLSLLTGIPD